MVKKILLLGALVALILISLFGAGPKTPTETKIGAAPSVAIPTERSELCKAPEGFSLIDEPFIVYSSSPVDGEKEFISIAVLRDGMGFVELPGERPVPFSPGTQVNINTGIQKIQVYLDCEKNLWLGPEKVPERQKTLPGTSG